jgi:hypothetical protein
MVEDNCWTSVLLHAPEDNKEYPSLADATDFQVSLPPFRRIWHTCAVAAWSC